MNHADAPRLAAALPPRLGIVLAAAGLLLGCTGSLAGQEAAGAPGSPDAVRKLAAEIEVCRVPDPQRPASAFIVTESEADPHGDYHMRWQCRETCADWRQCHVAARSWSGAARRALAFVVDGMGGHVAYTTGRGAKTVLLHDGLGGTNYLQSLAETIERNSDAGTVMVRWEPGFRHTWGWYTRTSAEASRVPELTRRVAAVIVWAHEHLAGPEAFATVGCSMGTQATFGAAHWYEEVDAVVDYQLFSGGPPLWDINAGCGLRTYRAGHCDLDAGVTCSADADCSQLGAGSRCDWPRPIPPFGLYQSVINHVHATQACAVPQAGAAATPYAPFDESGLGFSGRGDWDIDHPVDFAMDVRGPDGDENWALGDTMRVFNDVESAAGHAKRWHATVNSNHCAALYNGAALELILDRLDLR